MNPAQEIPLPETAGRGTAQRRLASALRLQRLLTEISSGFVTRPELETGEILAILDDVIRADKRAAEVIRNLREMLGDKPVHRDFHCLNELVAKACALFSNDPASEGVRLVLDAGRVPARIKLASVQIQQLLANLISNASHAMIDTPPDCRRIIVQTRASDGMVHLRVRDHGHGIPPQHLDRIFEPFHTTRRDGLGMGLAICRRIAQAHGGTLKAANHEAGGAEFTFSLPLPRAE